MQRRSLLLLATAASAFLSQHTSAESARTLTSDELLRIFRDDALLNRMLAEVWILRQLLLMRLGRDLNEDIGAFQSYAAKIRERRDDIIQTIELKGSQVSEEIIQSADKIAAELDAFGVKLESELSNRLVSAYIVFNQALGLLFGESLCQIYPFRQWCT